MKKSKSFYNRFEMKNYKYLLVQHTNKYWNVPEVFYLSNDEELSSKLKEIAKEQGVKIQNTDDPIKDVINAVAVFDYVHIVELNELKTFNSKMINLLFTKEGESNE